MNMQRAIISVFLFCCYTLGFAHNFFPHGEGVFTHAHSHELHHPNDNHNHDHITHGNHYDAGLYDFLWCLFNEFDHSEQMHLDENYNFTQNSVQAVVVVKAPLLATLLSFVRFSENSSSVESVDFYHAFFYKSLPPGSHSYRGPPFNLV